MVDCSATGHVLAQLNAARSLSELVRGGMIRGQVEWIDSRHLRRRRTGVLLTALPEEMPVVETIELYRDIVKQRASTLPAVCSTGCCPTPCRCRRAVCSPTWHRRCRGQVRVPGVAASAPTSSLPSACTSPSGPGASAARRRRRPRRRGAHDGGAPGLATTRAVALALREPPRRAGERRPRRP